MNAPKLITIAEYAAMRRTTAATIYVEYCNRKPGLPPRYRIGRRVFVDYQDAVNSILAYKLDTP
jgi:hypothetical protein